MGWIESHSYHKRLIKYRKPSALIIGDSIAKGLRRYVDVWDRYFGKHTVNLGIVGDKVEDIIWCIGNLDASKEVRYVALICGTNNIDKNVPADIVKDIKYAIQLVKRKSCNCKVIVSGILPRSPDIRRNKIRLVNIQIKYGVREMNNNNVTYIDPDHKWATSGGALNTNLYYKDNLHLIEKRNKKLAKAITTVLMWVGLKQQQNLSQIGQQHQQEHPQHQQKHHH